MVIKVKQFQKVLAVVQSTTNLDDEDKAIQMASALLDKPEDDVTGRDISQALELWKQYDFIIKGIASREAYTVPKYLRGRNIRMKLITDLSKLSGANIAELDSFTCEPDNIVARLHLILASITRTCKYRFFLAGIKKETDELWKARAAAALELNIIEAWDIAVFFFKVGQTIVKNGQKYGQKYPKLQEKMARRNKIQSKKKHPR